MEAYCNELENEYLKIDKSTYMFTQEHSTGEKSILNIMFHDYDSKVPVYRNDYKFLVAIVCGNFSEQPITPNAFLNLLCELYKPFSKPEQEDVQLSGNIETSKLKKDPIFYFGIETICSEESLYLSQAYTRIAAFASEALHINGSYDENTFRCIDRKVLRLEGKEEVSLERFFKDAKDDAIRLFEKKDVDENSAFAPLYKGVQDEKGNYKKINIILFLPSRYYYVFRSQTHCTPSFVKFVFLSQNPEVVAVKQQMGQQLKEEHEKRVAAEKRADAAEKRVKELERELGDSSKVQHNRNSNIESLQREESFTASNQETKDFEPGQSADKTNDATILPEKYVPADKSKTSENSDVLVDVTLENSQTTTQENALNMELVKQETVKSASMLQNSPKAKETTQTIPQANQTTELENNKTRGR